LANLILRFYDVTGGAIQIEEIDIGNTKPRDLRKNISSVPQSPTLINGTIVDNIKWSNPSAVFEQIIESSKKSMPVNSFQV
jgi:ABC-type multidrug transport system fused ATPase/permease subunit